MAPMPDDYVPDHHVPDHHVRDHYATLGVATSAPHATIRVAYRRMIRDVHPDVAGSDPASTARALAVNSAWSVLKDPVARASYDRERAAAGGAALGGPVAPGPSWGPGGVHPLTIEQLREAAAREAAYSEVGRRHREAFSAASRQVGVAILLLGMVLLALVAAR